MKSKYITHLIFEGTDGIGKNTLEHEVWKTFDFKYKTYARGELSDYVYAKVYNREFISTQRGLPFLYVLLTCDENQIAQRIMQRGKEEDDELQFELEKIEQQKLFIDAANKFKNDYHIIIVDITNLNIKEATDKIHNEVEKYINELKNDDEINPFNVLYETGAKKYGMTWSVKNNQPFLNDVMVMADAQLHNGMYETYTNHKTCPDTLLYSLGYSKNNVKKEKLYDFCYPINSKILVRPEIRSYIDVITKANKTILTTDSKYIPQDENIVRFPKKFGDSYIKEIATAKATIYCARDLAYLELLTARCYEAIMSNQVLFVDSKTDPENKILTQIYGKSSIKDLLYVDENNLIEKYNELFKDERKVDYILRMQHLWYDTLVKELKK